METTTRLGMPTIASGQAAKEVAHNEALFIADLLIGGAVEELPRNAPPASPAPGQAWIIGDTPSDVTCGLRGHDGSPDDGSARGYRIAPAAQRAARLDGD